MPDSMIMVGGIEVSSYIQQPVVNYRFRARSVVYALDGTAKEDRLGDAKKVLTLPFALVPADTWEGLRAAIMQNTVLVSGNIGGADVGGTYRLYGNDIPTPILVVFNENGSGKYVTQPFNVTLEEI